MIAKLSFQIIFIKYIFAFVIFKLLFNSNKSFIYIECDNKLSEYEENINFSEFSTDIKAISLYLPQFHEIEENNNFWGKGFTEWTNVKKSRPRFQGHHQPRIPGDKYGYLEYYDLTSLKAIKKQVKLAKSHGIYGFGIYYYWFSGKKLLEKPIDIFIEHSSIKFNFLLIWANENWSKRWDGRDKEILIKQEYKKNDPFLFIKDIKRYIKDRRYIKIEEKPVLGLYEPNKIPNLRKTISIWRKKSRQLGIGEIFILICINRNKTQDFQNLNLFNASYEFPPRNSFQNNRILNKRTLIYSEILYQTNFLNVTDANFTKFPFFRGSLVEWDNCPRIKNCEIFDHYSPEQFYMLNKIIVNWTLNHYNEDLRFIFINAWNEWGEGSYLEPDDKYGYASINSLSKAIFNISYSEKCNSIGANKVAILINIYKDISIEEIINKINNIPYIFDLFIYIDDKLNNKYIEQYIQFKSNAFNFQILLNKRKNILAFLNSIRNKIKNHKYICYINWDNHKDINYFEEWKNYIHNNLLGDLNIISEIIADFEKNSKLGLIFPEKFYKSLIQYGDCINNLDLIYVNSILRKLFPKVYAIQTLFDFPEGNMFWAKVSAIHQIFNLYSNIVFTKQYKLIIESYLEKIWVFLVKINGYSYKKIFKHL